MLAIYFSGEYTREEKLKIYNNYRYTVGTTIKSKYKFNGRDYILFKIKVNGKEYKVYEYNMKGLKPKGYKYISQYSIDNPGYAILLKDYPIKDTVFELPVNGWDSIPMKFVIRGRKN